MHNHVRSSLRIIVVTLGPLFCMGAAAHATTIFTDFGPGQSFDSGNVELVLGAGPFGSISLAAPFQPSITATFNSIDFAADTRPTATANNFTVKIAADSGGAPGTILETFTALAFPATTAIFTVNSTLHPMLSSGSTYWFIVVPGDIQDGGDLYRNSVGTVGMASSGNLGSTWLFTASFPTVAFDVNGTAAAVPEPSAIALTSIGALALFALKRRPLLR